MSSITNSSIAFSITVLLLACQGPNQSPDVSHIEIKPKLIRFEQELFEGDTQHIARTIERLSNKYPEFTDVYLYQILADPAYGNDGLRSTANFVKDSFIRELYDTCQLVYGDFSVYEQDLLQALKYFKLYFPDKPIPDIYTCISGFEVGSFTIGDHILGVGLDFYLGADYPNYHHNLFPDYIKASMNADHLVAKSVQALVANYLGDAKGNRLIDFMIRNGIELYIKKLLMPGTKEEILFEYSTEQLQWLQQNEAQIWGHLVEEDLLYSVNFRSFQKIINPSPSIPNMPPEAPGRLGNWIGVQIIENYLERNKDISPEELIQMQDAQKILAESKYKPRQ